MKGYVVSAGFMGYVDGEYELFATEEEYYEYMAAQWQPLLFTILHLTDCAQSFADEKGCETVSVFVIIYEFKRIFIS